MVTAGRRSEPQSRYNRAGEETVERSFESHSELSLEPAGQMKGPKSEFASLRHQLETSWPPLGKADRSIHKPRKSEWLWEKTALNWRSPEAPEGKSIADTAARKQPNQLPSIAVSEREEHGPPWSKAGNLRGGNKKMGCVDRNVPRHLEGKQGSRVSEKVAVFQQGKAKPKERSAPTVSPSALQPVKPPVHGSSVSRSKALGATKGTSWASAIPLEAGALSAAELAPTGNKLHVPGSGEGVFYAGPATLSSRGTRPLPRATGNLPEQPPSTVSTPQDRQHPQEGRGGKSAAHVAGEAEAGSIKTMPPCGGTHHPSRAEGSLSSCFGAQTYVAEHDAVQSNEASCLSEEPATPHTEVSSLEPEISVQLYQAAEQVNEDSETDNQELPGALMPRPSETNLQGSRENVLAGIKSSEPEVENKMQPESTSESYKILKYSPGHRSQERKPEERAISPSGQAQVTGDETAPCPQAAESQYTCGPLTDSLQGHALPGHTALSAKDISEPVDTHPKAVSATGDSHDKTTGKEETTLKLRGPDDMRGGILLVSEPPSKMLEPLSSKESSGKPEYHLAGNGIVGVKPQYEGKSRLPASAPQTKDTGNGEPGKETPAKASSVGKNHFARLFASENKSSTPRKELKGRKKPTKPQSALATLFGYCSDKEWNQKGILTPKPSPKLSEEKNDGESRSQITNSASSSQKASKDEAVAPIGRAVAISKNTKQNSGAHVGSGQRKSPPHLSSTEVLESQVLLSMPGESSPASTGNVDEVPGLGVESQPDFNTQSLQQHGDSYLPAVWLAASQKGAPETLEGRASLLQSPLAPIAPDDTSLSLTSEGSLHDTCLHEKQNLTGLGDRDLALKDETVPSSNHLKELCKESELHLESRDLLEPNNLLLPVADSSSTSISTNVPGIDDTDVQFPPKRALQNSQDKEQPSFSISTSGLHKENPGQKHDLAEEGQIIQLTGEIQSSHLLQQLDLQPQLQKDAWDPFGLRFNAGEPITDPLLSWGANLQPPSTSTPEPFNDHILEMQDAEMTAAAALLQASVMVEKSKPASDLP